MNAEQEMMKERLEEKRLATESVAVTHHSPLISHLSSLPFVSVVIPCLNEERFIGNVLQNLASQYDHQRYEIIVVDGGSADDTRGAIDNFATRNPAVRVRIVDNPARNIPTALNLGIQAAEGEIIVRMDAHSIPSAAYVRRCAELLTDGAASVVGMPWHIRPGADSLMGRAIALAVAHPFGIGDARYRLATGGPQVVDTVPFGAFKKSLWEQLGGFDEGLLTNEDYDFNYRVRRLGGQVLLDDVAHSDYFARGRLSELAAQYFRYGRWKAEMLKLHPRSVKWRQLAAPSFVTSLLILTAAGLVWNPARWLLVLEVSVYLLLSLVAGWHVAKKSGAGVGMVLLLPLVFATIHLTWGSSLIVGLIGPQKPRKR